MYTNQNIEKVENELKEILDEKRFRHTQGVMYTAAALAMRYSQNVNQALMAGLLHDCAKAYSDEEKLNLCKKNNIEITSSEQKVPSLLHAKLGAFDAENKFGVNDEDVLEAVRVHTTGKANMSMLQKIVYVADFIEPNRKKYSNMEQIRVISFENIDKAVFYIAKNVLEYLNKKGAFIDSLTNETYNYYSKFKER